MACYISPYVLATRCPVLTCCMMLPGQDLPPGHPRGYEVGDPAGVSQPTYHPMRLLRNIWRWWQHTEYPVLTLVAGYASLRIVLCVCYEMSSTDLGYADTRWMGRGGA
eukprot:1543513-Rhodomonas_salina.2